MQASGSNTDSYTNRGSLSDFSDYDSSDEETHNQRQAQAQAQGYTYRHGEEAGAPLSAQAAEDDDPFADPFADTGDVATPGIAEKPLWR